MFNLNLAPKVTCKFKASKQVVDARNKVGMVYLLTLMDSKLLTIKFWWKSLSALDPTGITKHMSNEKVPNLSDALLMRKVLHFNSSNTCGLCAKLAKAIGNYKDDVNAHKRNFLSAVFVKLVAIYPVRNATLTSTFHKPI